MKRALVLPLLLACALLSASGNSFAAPQAQRGARSPGAASNNPAGNAGSGQGASSANPSDACAECQDKAKTLTQACQTKPEDQQKTCQDKVDAWLAKCLKNHKCPPAS